MWTDLISEDFRGTIMLNAIALSMLDSSPGSGYPSIQAVGSECSSWIHARQRRMRREGLIETRIFGTSSRRRRRRGGLLPRLLRLRPIEIFLLRPRRPSGLRLPFGGLRRAEPRRARVQLGLSHLRPCRIRNEARPRVRQGSDSPRLGGGSRAHVLRALHSRPAAFYKGTRADAKGS